MDRAFKASVGCPLRRHSDLPLGPRPSQSSGALPSSGPKRLVFSDVVEPLFDEFLVDCFGLFRFAAQEEPTRPQGLSGQKDDRTRSGSPPSRAKRPRRSSARSSRTSSTGNTCSASCRSRSTDGNVSELEGPERSSSPKAVSLQVPSAWTSSSGPCLPDAAPSGLLALCDQGRSS
jgi:hypothetical protein